MHSQEKVERAAYLTERLGGSGLLSSVKPLVQGMPIPGLKINNEFAIPKCTKDIFTTRHHTSDASCAVVIYTSPLQDPIAADVYLGYQKC
jgi:hypothetical protein